MGKENNETKAGLTAGENKAPSKLPISREEAHLERNIRHETILSQFSGELEKYNNYLANTMTEGLGNSSRIKDDIDKTQLQEYPKTRGIEVLKNLYDNLYSAQKKLSEADPTFKLTNPPLQLSNYATPEEKIAALKEAMQKEIEVLKGSSTSEIVKDFATKLQNHVDTFNKNFDTINENFKQNPQHEARRIVKNYVRPKILEGLYLKDQNGKPLINHRDERREIFETVKDKITISNELLNIYVGNPAILEVGIGALLQPIADKFFAGPSGGHDLTKLNNEKLKEEFINEINQTLPKFVNIAKTIEQHKSILKGADYSIIGSKYISKVSNAKTSQELEQISSGIDNWIATKMMVDKAIEKSGITISLDTTQKIINILEEKFAQSSSLKNRKNLLNDVTKGLKHYKTGPAPGSEEEHLSKEDLMRLGDDLVKKHSKKSVSKEKKPISEKPSKTTSKVSLIDKFTNMFDLTNLTPNSPPSKTEKKTPPIGVNTRSDVEQPQSSSTTKKPTKHQHIEDKSKNSSKQVSPPKPEYTTPAMEKKLAHAKKQFEDKSKNNILPKSKEPPTLSGLGDSDNSKHKRPTKKPPLSPQTHEIALRAGKDLHSHTPQKSRDSTNSQQSRSDLTLVTDKITPKKEWFKR